jgi:hypothetical protein
MEEVKRKMCFWRIGAATVIIVERLEQYISVYFTKIAWQPKSID